MKRYLFILSLFSFVQLAEGKGKFISNIETNRTWIYVYDEDGNKVQTLSRSTVGEVMGWSSTFFVSRSGNWYYLYNAAGKRYRTMSVGSVGEILAVTGDTFTSQQGQWVYTWDKNGKRIKTRSAQRRW